VSATRRPRAATRRVSAASATETPLENRLKKEINGGIKRRLGLEESDKVPAEVQKLVDSAVREVAESAMATGVMRELESAAERLSGSWTRDRVVEAAVTSPDIELLAEAEYLAAKRKALQAAGFSNDEAMQLLVAEVTAGSSQRSDT
jgi:hypothetical protein